MPYMTGASCISEGETIVNRWTEKPRCIAYQGDVLLVCKGSGYGAIARLAQERAHIARQFMALKNLPNLDKTFNYYLAVSVIDNIKKDARGLIVGISRDAVLQQDVILPTLPEQTAIGNFFRTLDDLIAKQKRKCDGLKNLKKAYLQQMFPSTGEDVPKVRFDGFHGKWEMNKADEIFVAVSDKNHPHLPVLSASQEKGMILRSESGIDIKFDEKSLHTYKRIIEGQFAIHLRSFQGGFAYCTLEGITSPAYTVLDFINKKDHAVYYWKELFSSPIFIKRLETVTYGIRDGRSISFSEFSTLTLSYPSTSEQVVIGNFFHSLDEQISAHQQRLTQLQQLKTAYVQKMFV